MIAIEIDSITELLMNLQFTTEMVVDLVIESMANLPAQPSVPTRMFIYSFFSHFQQPFLPNLAE